jgi:hypothetical protein
MAGTPLLHQFALVPNGKADVWPHQCMAAHGFNAVRQFRGVGFQEFAAGRRGVKQLAHLHAGASRARGRFQLTGAAIELPGMVSVKRSRLQAHVGNGIDGGQRLAPKAHGAHGLQVLQ